MRAIADMIAGVLVEGREPEHVARGGESSCARATSASTTASANNLQRRWRWPPSSTCETLKRVEQRVLWLATSIVHHANRVRENRSRREGRRPPGVQREHGDR